MPGEHNGALRSRRPSARAEAAARLRLARGLRPCLCLNPRVWSRFHWWHPPVNWKVLLACCSPRSGGQALPGLSGCLRAGVWQERCFACTGVPGRRDPPNPAGSAAGTPRWPSRRAGMPTATRPWARAGWLPARAAFPPGHLRWSHEVICCLRN